MRWRQGRRSSNVEDRRGESSGGRGLPGGSLLPLLIGKFLLRRGGKKSLMIIGGLLLGMYVLGIDPRALLQTLLGGGSAPGQSSSVTAGKVTRSPEEDQLADFVAVVLADTEDTWNKIFKKGGSSYREPGLVLFSGGVRSACGMAQSAMGPFYCPGDEKVYIDLSFYQDLKNKQGAPGDFAQAYVIAHEIGHHVQNLLGISDKVQNARRRAGKAESNQLSVMLELQADCFAGIWGYHADRSRQILESGDIREAMVAAASIGDDRLQREAQGRVVPESFTHGTSEQRVRWFKRGIENGSLEKCNTFDADSL